MSDLPLVLPLGDGRADLAAAGGKGASLARMAAAGLPVPPGFHITTAAYDDFVTTGDLRDRVVAAVPARPVAGDDATGAYDEAAGTIQALFASHDLPEPTVKAIREAYSALGEPAVAVRSSATAEDLPGLSFAGQQDTYLNIQGEAALLDAVRRCWASLWGARAMAYRARNGIAADEVTTAVVVQELVPADAAGVLFTANPVTGAMDQMIVNAAWGLGEAVVGGQVTADTIVAARPGGAILEQRISEKTVMTVRTDGGTAEVPVPEARRALPVLDAGRVTALVRLGERVEALYGAPMDVEWALHDGALFVLQARPITTAPPEEWNDSLAGDYLWSNGNLGEAIPDVMTPSTYSFVQIFMSGAMRTSSLAEFRAYGIVGGRFYMNLSLAATIATAFGMGGKFNRAIEPVFGKIPPGMEIPLIPLSRWRMFRAILPAAIALKREVRANTPKLPAFFAAAPGRCERLRERIQATSTAAGLAELWHAEAGPYLLECSHMLEAATRQDGKALTVYRDQIVKLAGDSDAAALFTGLQARSAGSPAGSNGSQAGADGAGTGSDEAWAGSDGAGAGDDGAGGGGLASLGLLLGLERLSRGEIDRETFARRWGHRGPSEFEVSIARPGEDPEWIDRQLAGLREAEHDVGSLLARQEETRAAAWKRFTERHPAKVTADTRRKIARMTKALRDREVARSEVVRAFWAMRTFVQRAGQLTGHGDDLFFLPITELLTLLTTTPAPTTAGTASSGPPPTTTTGSTDEPSTSPPTISTAGSGHAPMITSDPADGAPTSLPTTLSTAGSGHAPASLGVVRARRATYERYRALPPYPSLILGRFDPVRWAADPDRRGDVYDERAAAVPASDTVRGFAGAAGVVEGRVRVITSVDQSALLRPGEILVTTVTNVGWTPLFPRAAAVVTDVGAPLSHAAIVARELGIPAVVGCGNATARLHTGDLVRVDGGLGTVELLHPTT
ncbi:PEP/pyruvate-binding domain-containing protein [Sphaerisporangium corydalis]|uniref:PEP/pyruvate-binding domain-containing protein n=1 Tax=Sphaerisporangium corydalis TaxID=1441875 RepID=A0ABV9EA63_9ACTN|nr:PEP/pyruvate-binding domain-containing protein [Sphaerisporangium corydalis]